MISQPIKPSMLAGGRTQAHICSTYNLPARSVGQTVEIHRGSLAGVTGELVRPIDDDRLLIKLTRSPGLMWSSPGTSVCASDLCLDDNESNR